MVANICLEKEGQKYKYELKIKMKASSKLLFLLAFRVILIEARPFAPAQFGTLMLDVKANKF